MAVDSKLGETKLGIGANGANGANGAVNGASTAVPQVAEGTKRTKRTSSLMRSASSLPKVEHSLDEFIARANQTLVDVSNWGTTDQVAKEEDEKRREQDALRWKQAETQMKESEARESSLRGQLDGLQGKLAEAEARAAVAMSSSSNSMKAVGAHDSTLDNLRKEIELAQQRMRSSEQKSQELAKALELAKTEVAARPAVALDSAYGHDDAEERIRHAEAKAAKALAAARAAAAGLTVSSADLAAIESGLVVPMQPEKRTPWIAIMLAFAGGLGIMFLVWKFALSNPAAAQLPTKTEPVAPPPAAEVKLAPTPPPVAPPTKPTVTPIDDGVQPAAVDDTKQGPTVTPIDEPPVKAEVKTAEPEVKPAEPEVKPEPVVKKPVEPKIVKKPAVTKPAVRKDKKPAKPAGGIADPFADPPAAPKKPAPKKPEKPAGGIVDPFGGG